MLLHFSRTAKLSANFWVYCNSKIAMKSWSASLRAYACALSHVRSSCSSEALSTTAGVNNSHSQSVRRAVTARISSNVVEFTQIVF